MYKSSKSPSNTGSSSIPDSGLLSSTTTISTLFRCGNSLSPHLSCYPSRKSGLEGRRKVYVDLPYSVVPDPEFYMTEYAAIHIVFTLQGLYTCTHSPRIQLGISRLSILMDPAIGGSGSRPFPLTRKLYPPTSMMSRIASSG